MITKQLLASKRVLVVGDSMLDKYWFGDANRISPEAPVPVVRVVKDEMRLGGAANVAHNISSIGLQCSLMSIIGEDYNGKLFQKLLDEAGIHSFVCEDPDLKTTVKLRIIARQQQLVRLDFEERPGDAILQCLLDKYQQQIANCDSLVLSDYGKGCLDNIEKLIASAKEQGKFVLIDPKGDNYDRYSGATLITPNRAEFALVAGSWTSEAELECKAQELRNHLKLDAILLTRSEEGMTLFTAQGATTIPAQAREVFDVSGAGDTVIAITASMLAAGVPLLEAVKIANRAGGIVVGKLGTASVSFEELFG